MVNQPVAYTPQKGDAVWINLDPQAGHEQAGRRPAVVLSQAVYNGKAGLALICPITNRAKGYPFEVVIPPGLPLTGVILADQVKNLDWRARRIELICKVPDEQIAAVIELIESMLRGIV